MTTTHVDLDDAAIDEAAFVAAITDPKHLAADHGTSIGGVAAPPDPLAAIPAQHRGKYRELAYRVSQGDSKAEAELSKLEGQIADAERLERRQLAAQAEEHRRAEEAAEKRAAAVRKAKERHHAQLVAKREESFAEIEAATETLAGAVRSALAVDQEIWSLALRLGWSPERRTSNRITNYVGTQLGRLGGGLGDMPTPTHSSLRGPLTTKTSKE
ncbi:hypothetical protein EPN29_01910 [bacterium]|nr:MAG: hypothetical protein EPN29_01910 [bacterium]